MTVPGDFSCVGFCRSEPANPLDHPAGPFPPRPVHPASAPIWKAHAARLDSSPTPRRLFVEASLALQQGDTALRVSALVSSVVAIDLADAEPAMMVFSPKVTFFWTEGTEVSSGTGVEF